MPGRVPVSGGHDHVDGGVGAHDLHPGVERVREELVVVIEERVEVRLDQISPEACRAPGGDLLADMAHFDAGLARHHSGGIRPGQHDDRPCADAVLILNARDRAAQRLDALVLSRGPYDDVDSLIHEAALRKDPALVYFNAAARESSRRSPRNAL